MTNWIFCCERDELDEKSWNLFFARTFSKKMLFVWKAFFITKTVILMNFHLFLCWNICKKKFVFFKVLFHHSLKIFKLCYIKKYIIYYGCKKYLNFFLIQQLFCWIASNLDHHFFQPYSNAKLLLHKMCYEKNRIEALGYDIQWGMEARKCRPLSLML